MVELGFKAGERARDNDVRSRPSHPPGTRVLCCAVPSRSHAEAPPVLQSPPGEGQEIYFGVFSRDIERPIKPNGERMTLEEFRAVNKAEREKRRREAAERLMNIGPDERTRRKRAGQVLHRTVALPRGALRVGGPLPPADPPSLPSPRQVLSVATVALAAYMVATEAAWSTRVALFPLVFLSYGYLQSARLGLCNIGNARMWDVDGCGLARVEDDQLADALRAKVNRMNVQGLLLAAVITAAFAAVPLG